MSKILFFLVIQWMALTVYSWSNRQEHDAQVKKQREEAFQIQHQEISKKAQHIAAQNQSLATAIKKNRLDK